jgi:hypothetical protein
VKFEFLISNLFPSKLDKVMIPWLCISDKPILPLNKESSTIDGKFLIGEFSFKSLPT